MTICSAKKPKCIVIGLGNPILSDDRIGVYMAEQLRNDFSNIDFNVTASSGFHLLDYLMDYDRAIIIDSIVTRNDPPGSVKVYETVDFENFNPFSLHSTDLITAIEIWKQYRLPVPKNVSFIGIEVMNTTTFGEDFSPEIETLRETILESVREMLKQLLED
jgi:hydrogenase maturation protease